MRKNKIEVWNRKIDPEDYPDFYLRKATPVTREDLDNRFHTMALRQFRIDKNGYMDRYKEEIKLFTEAYDFGDVLWLHYRFIFAKNFKEVVQYIKAKGLYVFDIWGYVPTASRRADPEYLAANTPNGNAHEYLLQQLGPRFLGWDNGEQDGAYFYGYAPLFCPAPQNRREGYEGFSKYFHRLCAHMENYLITLLGMYFPHYMAHFGNHRLLGAETAQRLPSVPPWYAFIRGAGKQYGILWFGNASVFGISGYKRYGKETGENKHLQAGGPDKGTSLELFKRLWYVEYMYGCCIMGYEQSHIYDVCSDDYLVGLDDPAVKLPPDFPKDKPPAITPVGQLQLNGAKWCKAHPDMGVQYTPVALLLDVYSGWAPPRTVYNRGGSYLVWGNMDYEKGDHQVDAFFRLVYPAYEDCAYYRNEKGYLTPTPAGDIFDVLLSNVSDEVLGRYNAAILLGEIKLHGKILDKITRFLNNGGQAIVSLNQMTDEARKEFNIESGGVIKESNVSRMGDETFKEKLFQYEALGFPASDILAVSKDGDPLIIRKKYGAGELSIIAADFGLNKDEDQQPLPALKALDTPLSARYHLLECVKSFLLDYLKNLNLVEVAGPPIQYITNVTDDPRKIYLTLSNNENELWEGKIKVKSGAPIEVEDLFNNQTMRSSKGTADLKVSPLDIGIYSIAVEKPIVTFKQPLDRKDTDHGDYRLAVWSRADSKGSIWQNIEVIGRSSIKYIELCAAQLLSMDDRELSLVSEEIKAGDLCVSALSLVHAQTPYVDDANLTTRLPRTLEESRKYLSRSLEVARKLYCSRIILSPGWSYGIRGEEALEITARMIAEFGGSAEEKGIGLLIEPAPYKVLGTAEELIKLMDTVDSANVGIALDTGHSFWFDPNPANVLRKLGERVKYININSSHQSTGGALIDKHLMPGKGVFDEALYETFFKTMKEINYKGFICYNCFFAEPIMDSLKTVTMVK